MICGVFDKHLQLGILGLAKALEDRVGSAASRKDHSRRSIKGESHWKVWMIHVGGPMWRVEERVRDTINKLKTWLSLTGLICIKFSQQFSIQFSLVRDLNLHSMIGTDVPTKRGKTWTIAN